MDLNAIKAKLAEMNSGNSDREKIDYDKVFWKPSVGKHQVRILPSAHNPAFPFTEIKFHYGIGKYPMVALSNFGKQDPIEEFVKELRKTSDKDNWSLAGKLTPKVRIFAPVVVRGEEDMGVRLWGFGKTIFKALLSLAEDEDVGDYTDVVNGFDLVVEQVAGNPYPETTVRIKPKMSPVTADTALAEKWMKEQPDPMESFTKYDYEFIKRQLMKYLDPNSEEEETPAPAAKPAPANDLEEAFAANSAAHAPEKKNIVSKFDDLFD
jgi:hypothetical protein